MYDASVTSLTGREHLSYRLPVEFVQRYVREPVAFGFPVGGDNSLGELTMLDKYSAKKEDGTKERWWEICRRVTEGVYSTVKDYCLRNRTPWSDEHAHEDAQEMFDRMFHMKWMPPGRGLQFMGRAYVWEEGSACLQNCAFLSTENMDKDPVLPFVRLMEMSMLGIGVGTDTRGAGKISVGRPTDDIEYVTIEDSREGWVDTAARVLSEYLVPGTPFHIFDASNIRPAGSPIKRFGGTAAGPGPLLEMIDNLRLMLGSRSGETVDSRLITDLANMVGRCVVSGNLRRTAEIVLGHADDKDFLSLKDWTVRQNAVRLSPKTGWGYISNNSVIGHVGMDLSHVTPGMAMNGEPGVYYLDLAQQYGRLGDPPNGKNWRVTGCNPCVEQPLEDHELCTLVETFPAKHEDVADFQRTLKYAYLYGKAVTLIPTHWKESNTVMVRNRRIGCSMSGVVQFVNQRGLPELRRWCDEGYAEVCRRDEQYSDWLGIRESIGKTSVKPSGTVSILAGATPGVHFPVKRGRYWRRVRYSKHNPTLAVLEAAGYHVEDCVNEPHATSIVRFPAIGPDVRGEDEATLFEKAALAAFLQRHWADNMVSATFTFTPDEAAQVPNVLATFEGQLKAASFLPLSTGQYPQMPYEEADPDEWQAAFDAAQRVDVDLVYGEQALEAVGDKFCSNDTCEVPQRA